MGSEISLSCNTVYCSGGREPGRSHEKRNEIFRIVNLHSRILDSVPFGNYVLLLVGRNYFECVGTSGWGLFIHT